MTDNIEALYCVIANFSDKVIAPITGAELVDGNVGSFYQSGLCDLFIAVVDSESVILPDLTDVGGLRLLVNSPYTEKELPDEVRSL